MVSNAHKVAAVKAALSHARMATYETAAGTAIALKGKRKNGGVPASPVISLEQLLAIPAKDRTKWLKENADTELTGEADKRLKAAATPEEYRQAQ